MYWWLIKLFITCNLFFSLVCCGFVDLRPIGLTTIPEEPYAILPHANSPVVLRFDTQMQEKETEGVLQIISPSGTVDGDLVWKGDELYFVPASSWMKGIRYVAKISGTVYSKDGRDLYISRELPFYAVAVTPLPFLVSSDPVDGASTQAFIPGETMLSLRFSLPMDKISVEAALNGDGIDQKLIDNEKYFIWSDDDKVLSIRPRYALSAWTVYRWSVSEKALSRDGAPLAKAVSGRFITDKDDVFPCVSNVVPLIRVEENNPPWGSWTRNDVNLDRGLGYGQAIGVEFSKDIDMDKIKSSISIEPSLPGHLEIVSPRNAVYIPENNPEPEKNYLLKISGDIKDARGLKMGQDHSVYFYSDIPYLSIHSIKFIDDPVTEIPQPKKAEFYQAYTKEADNGVIRFSIRFSLPILDCIKSEMTAKISLIHYFPGSLGSVSLRSVSWISSDLVQMEWEGIQGSKADEPHYYRLVLPGGRSGFNNGKGSYLKEETYFFIKAVSK